MKINLFRSFRRVVYRDPRVRKKSVTLANYLTILFSTLFFCGAFTGLYFLQFQDEEPILIILSMLGFVLAMSLVVCLALAIVRHLTLIRPVNEVCDAAKKVASGDYTVRLTPRHANNKKNEFDVLYDDFNTMIEELSSTEMLKNDLISNVSHELKTPLSIIQNYATILQNEQLTDEERRMYSRRIGEASARLSVLITNILQVNRLENQKITPKLSPFNLSEALSRCILNYDMQLDEKNIALETDMDQDLILTSDEDLLDMVLNNLLSNAVKFTPEGGTIRTSLCRADNMAIIKITDTGIGMTRDCIRHIFDKFYQADTSHTTEGNGLGLALVKRILELLGGKIEVRSTPKEGSEFTVYLNLP